MPAKESQYSECPHLMHEPGMSLQKDFWASVYLSAETAMNIKWMEDEFRPFELQQRQASLRRDMSLRVWNTILPSDLCGPMHDS